VDPVRPFAESVNTIYIVFCCCFFLLLLQGVFVEMGWKWRAKGRKCRA